MKRRLVSLALSLVFGTCLPSGTLAQSALPGVPPMPQTGTTSLSPENLSTAEARALQAQRNGTTNFPASSTLPSQVQDPNLLYPSPTGYHLASGDVIRVSVYGQDYTASVRIDEQGSARLPLLGFVPLASKSIQDAQDFLASRFESEGIFRAPEVTLSLAESPGAVATLYGEIHGVIPVLSERRLIDVILQAGGLPATASHLVTIVRAKQTEPITIDLGRDPYTSPGAETIVMPGDRIYIGRAGVVYMVGAFKTQGVLPLSGNTPLTLMEATALSGGPDLTLAKESNLRLIRTINGKRTFVQLDVRKVLYGKVADPFLQPDDIVFLPTSALRESVANGTLNLLLSGISLALSSYSITR
ncbi:MAG: polysaccharide biosynthesis/export family protein [Acidobacteriaceae bacterium]|nr:polysaccharide biosynthesis/export family protein [Acidobacteriaceae bacterium]